MVSMGRLLATTFALFALTAAPAAAIVGGKDAPAGTYDAVANVHIAGGGCTGTLIAPDWVLSAGHCGSATGGIIATPIAMPGASITVTLGTTAADGNGGDQHSVDRVVLSSQYLATQGHDISLLHLTSGAREQPVAIAGRAGAAIWAPGVKATIAGFGTTSEGGDAPSTMQVAEVPIVKDDACAAAYPSSFESATQLCAGYEQGGTDTCQGDSGGPLFGHDATGALKLIGATSYGEGCAQPGKYGIYARVADAELREWIRSVVPGAIDDAASLTPVAATTTTTTTPPTATHTTAKPRIVSLRGTVLTVKVPVAGRITVRWSASGRHGTRKVVVVAGIARVRISPPRKARRVMVSASLRPTGASADGAKVSRVFKR